jgi:hypothetical protein
MISLRKLVYGAAALVVLGATASSALAFGGPMLGQPNGACKGPFCNQGRYPTLASYVFRGHNTQLPVFQAAPWYLYWPYDAHFLTPAPVTGAFYGPPIPGNFPVNPYFPGPAYGHFGPIPGGPPPGGVLPPPPAGLPALPR